MPQQCCGQVRTDRLTWCRLAGQHRGQGSHTDLHQLNDWPQGPIGCIAAESCSLKRILKCSNTSSFCMLYLTVINTFQYCFFSLIAKWQSLRGNCNRLLWSLAVIYPNVWKATLEYRTTSGKYVCLLIWTEIKTSQGQERLILALELLRMIRKCAFFFFFPSADHNIPCKSWHHAILIHRF